MKEYKTPNLVANLPSINVREIAVIGSKIIEGGITSIEIPMPTNIPKEPIEELASLSGILNIGVREIKTVCQVKEIIDSSFSYIVTDITNSTVIEEAKSLGVWCQVNVFARSEVKQAIAENLNEIRLSKSIFNDAQLKSVVELISQKIDFILVGKFEIEDVQKYKNLGVNRFGHTSLYSPVHSSAPTESAKIRTEKFHNVYNFGIVK